jgi:hypothetical protein
VERTGRKLLVRTVRHFLVLAVGAGVKAKREKERAEDAGEAASMDIHIGIPSRGEYSLKESGISTGEWALAIDEKGRLSAALTLCVT